MRPRLGEGAIFHGIHIMLLRRCHGFAERVAVFSQYFAEKIAQELAGRVMKTHNVSSVFDTSLGSTC